MYGSPWRRFDIARVTTTLSGHTSLLPGTGVKISASYPENARNPVEGVETLPSTPRSRRITDSEHRRVFAAINEVDERATQRPFAITHVRLCDRDRLSPDR